MDRINRSEKGRGYLGITLLTLIGYIGCSVQAAYAVSALTTNTLGALLVLLYISVGFLLIYVLTIVGNGILIIRDKMIGDEDSVALKNLTIFIKANKTSSDSEQQ